MLQRLNRGRRARGRCAAVLPVLLAGVWTSTASALIPAPLNDTPSTAQNVGPTLPTLIYGSTVLASDAVSTTSGAVPALDTVVDGPDVFYRIEPAVTGTYRFHLAPWQHAPLRSSERQFALYMMEDLGGGSFTVLPGAGIRAAGSARAVHLDVSLLAGGKYVLGVDQNAATHDEADFTLAVDLLNLTNPDNCASAEVLPSTLPVVRLNDIDSATADYNFTQSTEQCAVSGTTPTTAPGNDHVYQFTPSADGYYAIELISDGWNPVIYVDDSCPPFFGDSCQGASDHSTGGSSGGKHEFVVVYMFGGIPYYIYVDQVAVATGAYTLIIDDAVNYEVTEEEPNDSPATASVPALPLAGGQLVGPADIDYWAVTGDPGDRVYAWVNNGGSSNSTLDTELRFYAPDGSTLIEYDDDDGEGSGGTGTIDLYYFVHSTSCALIAGAQMTGSGTHYLEVRDDDSTDTRTVSRYRMNIGVEPAARSPQPEVEPNNDQASATVSGLNYFTGAIDPLGDEDWYAFNALEGDHVFIAVDGDPERDSTGSASATTDTNAFPARIDVYDADGDPFIIDVSDSNSAQTGGGDYPAQATYFVVPEDGAYKVRITSQSTGSVGPKATYDVAIFINGEPPFLAELMPPVVTATPDYPNDVIDVTATDNQPGDTGICSVELINTNNLMITGLSFSSGDPSVSFAIELEDGSTNGSAVLVVTDCAGNTALEPVAIDVSDPLCDGLNFSTRAPMYMGDPIHVPNNNPDGATNAFIEVPESGLITDVNVTVNIDSIDLGDVDLYLISPSGTSVELVTDRMSSLAYAMRDTTFDDSADAILSFSSSDAPYTGSWLPEDPQGLAKLNGEDAQGTWKLRVVDDSSSEDFGQTLVSWSLDITATFAGPEQFAGSVADLGDGGGIQSIMLTSGTNVTLDVDPAFLPGDQHATYLLSLIDPGANGTAEVTVTDFQENSCVQVINLAGLPDVTGPANTGSATTDLTFKSEVQQEVPTYDLIGVTDTIVVPDSFPVGEVEVALMVDSKDQGRNAVKLTHNGETAMLVNRIGMDERDSVGNTKGSFDIYLDDDAPQADDIHNESVLGVDETVGLYQPDARGEFYGNGITSDPRDAFLFRLAGLDAAGNWDLNIIDARAQSSTTTFLRRWALTLKA
ncbi:MAG TPA: proprotein convertase P-domain-containing protein, partial [Phycisphaerae bacterium]|nr:proprotein convertase P-domain-containing protein [Phycisphaerae bacterium]